MDTPQRLFLSPCNNALALGHLHQQLSRGVAPETVTTHSDRTIEDPVPIWGVEAGNQIHWDEVASGDFVLFYTGNRLYEYAGKVQQTEHNPALASEIWDDTNSSWEYLIFFDAVIEVEIDADEISDAGELLRPHPVGFTKLAERGVEQIVDAHGSLEQYITNRAVVETALGGAARNSMSDELIDSDSFEYQPRFESIARQLQVNKQVIFHGPPGTGKTYTARHFARWWISEQSIAPTESQLRLVTFHPSFTYEDFLEGLTAAHDSNGTGVRYTIQDGIFKQICEDAAMAAANAHANGHDPPPYILLIDEINRGNIAQIFGETITLLETDKRQTVYSELAHSSEPFTVPSNLYLIGTMNTADRSIALVDAALRRRFRFLSFPPAYDTLIEQFGLGSMKQAKAIATSDYETLNGLQSLSVLALERLNNRIIHLPDLGKGKQIGHSYLLLQDRKSEQELYDAWRYDILPLLEEYFFGQLDRLQQDILGDAGEIFINSATQEINDFSLEELTQALHTLAGFNQRAGIHSTATQDQRNDDESS